MTAQPLATARTDVQVRLRHVLRAELGKLASLRALRVAMAAVPLLVVGGMLLRAFAYAQTALHAEVGVPPTAAWQDVLAIGVHGGELAVLVLAAIAVGSEYTGRAALTTFTAVPRRLLVLVAKWAVVLGAVAVLAALGLVVGTALAAPLMAAARLAPDPSAVAGAAAALVLLLVVAAFSLAVATLVRSTAAGITIVLAVLLVLPVAASLVGRVIGVDLGPFLLTYAAPMATALQDPAGAGALAGDVAVALLWLVVPGAAAAVALRRRDV